MYSHGAVNLKQNWKVLHHEVPKCCGKMSYFEVITSSSGMFTKNVRGSTHKALGWALLAFQNNAQLKQIIENKSKEF